MFPNYKKKLQYHLTAVDLKAMGFKKKIVEDKVTYELSGINSCFYYNTEEVEYAWYYKTTLGDSANHVHLNIESFEELERVLKVFGIEHEKIYK